MSYLKKYQIIIIVLMLLFIGYKYFKQVTEPQPDDSEKQETERNDDPIIDFVGPPDEQNKHNTASPDFEEMLSTSKIKQAKTDAINETFNLD